MAQNINIALPVNRYSRADFTALRAMMSRLPMGTILNLYYCEDDQELLGLNSSSDLKARLEDMRDNLIQRASDTHPHLAKFLQDARRTSVWSKSAVNYLVQAADEDTTSPRPDDPMSLWFRGSIANRLKEEGAATLADLAAMINRRGHGWYRPIPRMGAKKARAIENWFRSNRYVSELITAGALIPVVSVEDRVMLDPFAPNVVLAPLERIDLPSTLSGENGLNRNQSFCLISARNDLEAVDAYLYRYRGQDKTYRAYQKELERFLLWCVQYRRKPMASVLQDDCEAYKDFLVDPDKSWIGHRATRMSPQWKPFAGKPSPDSQLYAVRTLRAFFTWLVNVRYLQGNPWATVQLPRVVEEETPIQIHKALPAELWNKLAGDGGILDWMSHLSDAELRSHIPHGWLRNVSMSSQFRVVRAAILLMGETGMRREEAARATRDKLKPVREAQGLWELSIIGKRNKRRTVYVPENVVEALREHWADRGDDFDFSASPTPLLCPLTIPVTKAAQDKHFDEEGERQPGAFTPDSLGRVVSKAFDRLASDPNIEDFSLEDRDVLQQTAAHALRHTFGTLSIADDVSTDVVQQLLGHRSLATTSIYVRAERQRAINEVGKMHARRAKRNGG